MTPARRAGDRIIGVLLMSFGTATSVADVPAYLTRVRGGAPPPPPMVEEFQRRFALVGGSPLVRITEQQARALEARLNAQAGAGPHFRVGVGMRFSAPTISDGLAGLLEAGARRVLGIVLSPQYSSHVLAGYLRDFQAASAALPPDAKASIAGAWHLVPEYLETLATLVREGLRNVATEASAPVPVVFTAHSLPQRVADQDPAYLQQLQDTARVVAERTGLAPSSWSFAFQSAGRTAEPWLGPDLLEVLTRLRADGHRSVLVAPVQFVSDHLEVLYDIDVAARERAATLGMRLERTASPNARPQFIEALAAVVHREISACV